MADSSEEGVSESRQVAGAGGRKLGQAKEVVPRCASCGSEGRKADSMISGRSLLHATV